MREKNDISVAFVIVTHNPLEVLLFRKMEMLSFFDELIVVSTNHREKYYLPHSNAKLYFKNFENYFPSIKNFALNKVKSDWIFTLDTDEDVDAKLIENIPQLIQSNNIDGYFFRRRYYLTRKKFLKYGVFYPDYQMRLFRNKPEYRFFGGVHAILPIPNRKTQKISMDIHHFSTMPKYNSYSNFVHMIPYIKMDASEYVKSNRNCFKLFIIGVKSFFSIFFGGFFRGKGFLDGWAGFRAHLLFGLSISLSYWLAAYKRIMRQI